MDGLVLEQDIRHDGKHTEADALLYHLQLHQIEGATVALKAQAVGRHLTTVFQKGDAPGKENHEEEGPVVGDT